MATGMRDEAPTIWPADSASRLLGLATGAHLRAAVFLIVVSLAAFLPGFFRIPPIDRDEARYAQATRQMIETGDYLDIRFQNQPRYLQPVGIYWLQAAAAHLTGKGERAPIWVHRLPSLVGATASVVLTYWVALPFAGEIGGLIAALFMAASILLGVEARLAKTDATLLAAMLGAMGFLARAYLRRTLALPGALAFWLLLGAGLMVKGPLILLPIGTTALALSAWDRSAAWLKALRPLYGTGLLLAVVLPWLIAITIVSDGQFWTIAIGQSLLGKVTVGQQSHGAPPGTYLALFWVTFWPAAALAVVAAPWVWRNRHEPRIRFCLAWIVPTWIVFELVVTKLPHYVLLVYPAIAILIALALLAGKRPGRIIAALIVLGGIIHLAVAAGALFVIERRISATALILALAGIGVLIWAVRAIERVPAQVFAAAMALAAILLNGAAIGVVAPKLQSLWLSPRLVAAAAHAANCPHPQLAAAGYHEPSLVFLGGTATQLVDGSDAADFLHLGGCRIALVDRRQELRFHGRLEQLGEPAVLRGRVTGLNLSNGRRQDIGVYAGPAR